MNKKFHNRIIQALRKLSFSWPARNECKKAARVAPATLECAACKGYFYEGTSDKTFEKVSLELSKPVTKGKVHIDHIEPVICPKEGFTTWDSYIDRMFCPIEGLQVLCSDCHDKKTEKEDEIRKQQKKLTQKKK